MKNSQLQTLLSRTPLCEEDIYNVCVIFEAMSDERKIHILNHWEKYIAKIIAEKEKLDKKSEEKLLESLKQANTILDATIAHEAEKNFQKMETKRQIREELKIAMDYEKAQRERKINTLNHFPHQ